MAKRKPALYCQENNRQTENLKGQKLQTPNFITKNIYLMIAASFEYDAPSTLEDAIGLLRQYGDGAKILSGGYSLLPMMKFLFA